MIEVEARLMRLEQTMTQLQISDASLSKSVEHLANTVNDLSHTVSTLRDLVNKGRGVLATIIVGAGALGSLFTLAFDRFLTHTQHLN